MKRLDVESPGTWYVTRDGRVAYRTPNGELIGPSEYDTLRSVLSEVYGIDPFQQ